jgi:hypothetical protein
LRVGAAIGAPAARRFVTCEMCHYDAVIRAEPKRT